MLLKLIDQKIRKAFSDSALQYEALTGLQYEIGCDLIKMILSQENCEYILDVGMGTGRLTNRLQWMFPESKVIGIDFASGMIRVARQKYEFIKIVQADCLHLPFKKEIFDIVFSNLLYQWVKPLDLAFKENYAVLKKNGIFCFTMFGRRTLKEMFNSLENSLSREETPKYSSLKRLPDLQSIENEVTNAGFQILESQEEIIKVHFEDLFMLLKWLKNIGANIVNEEFPIGKNWLLRADEYYKKHFRDPFGITTSFEVLWIKAVK